MLLFWSKDRTAELWVGSHNWTNRAILGLNVEASLVIRVRDTAPPFRAAAGGCVHRGRASPRQHPFACPGDYARKFSCI
jgi:hypothetical protein